MTKNAEAKQIAQTVDAYSRDRYTDAGWNRIAVRLAAEGFTPEGIKWVLTSKHMRWAADCANRNHSATAADFEAYILHSMSRLGSFAALRAEAQKETAGSQAGADLAGNCEGEDIAELIDLVRMVAKGQGSNAGVPALAKALLARIEAGR